MFVPSAKLKCGRDLRSPLIRDEACEFHEFNKIDLTGTLLFAFVRTVAGAALFYETGIGIKVCPPSCVPHHKQGQNLPVSILRGTLRGIRDAALIGLLLGCGLRRIGSPHPGLDQIQQWEEYWILADLVGKGERLGTVPVPGWSNALIDGWIRDSGVTEGGYRITLIMESRAGQALVLTM